MNLQIIRQNIHCNKHQTSSGSRRRSLLILLQSSIWRGSSRPFPIYKWISIPLAQKRLSITKSEMVTKKMREQSRDMTTTDRQKHCFISLLVEKKIRPNTDQRTRAFHRHPLGMSYSAKMARMIGIQKRTTYNTEGNSLLYNE